MNFCIETERETDGRWISEIPQLPGVMVYANSREDTVLRVQALALRVLAEKVDPGELHILARIDRQNRRGIL